MKAAALTLALIIGLAAPAMAGSCDEGLAKIATALQSADLSPDVKAEVTDMRKQAEQLCGEGNEEEGTDVLAEAAALLGID
jgi:hypothetical protein